MEDYINLRCMALALLNTIATVGGVPTHIQASLSLQVSGGGLSALTHRRVSVGCMGFGS
jgi:hypothetical protein